jgi:hypothetical protein
MAIKKMLHTYKSEENRQNCKTRIGKKREKKGGKPIKGVKQRRNQKKPK